MKILKLLLLSVLHHLWDLLESDGVLVQQRPTKACVLQLVY